MIRRIVPLIAIFALLVQSLVALWPGAAPTSAVPLEHILMHAQAPDHHHHDDRSLHVEEQGDSVKHSHADEGVFNCVVSDCTGVGAEAPPASTFARVHAPDPRPVLDGPFRPPRLA